MAGSRRLAERVAPLLPGEQVQHVFLAQGGANPWIGNSLGMFNPGMVKRRIVAVTDRHVVVLGATVRGTEPTEVLERLPRGTRIGPTRGLWSRIQLGGEQLWVHARFRRVVAAVDAAAGSS